MVTSDLAKRVYDHTWKLDPIIRSLLDTDFYKLLMLQMIWGLYRDRRVTFSVMNRTAGVRIADEIDERELRDQLDHARTLRLTKKERIFSLPPYDLRVEDGQFVLHFEGPWAQTTMWEIPALAILNELRSRAALKGLGRFELDVLYARAKTKLWSKVERLRRLPDLSISDFGSRRRHGFLWQSWCVQALKEGLGEAFTGSSHVLLAMNHDLTAIGTNAHELPMVLAALAPDDRALTRAPYQVLRDWQSYYGGNLLIVLPDAFGTAAFLRDAPDWIADWTGFRPDSAPPVEGGEMILDWWRAHGRDPRDKRLVFSDALDVDTIESTYRHFAGRVRMSFGWGTNLTNDFRDCAPAPNTRLKAISLVCKVSDADGRPAVKLSDNPGKASGEPAEIERYLRVFGRAGRVAQDVVV